MIKSKQIKANDLKKEIIRSLTNQGFVINKEINPENFEKQIIKKIHTQKRLEQLAAHKNFLLENMDFVREHSLKTKKIVPKNIKLKLLEVKADSDEARLFLWWNLAWWSLPFDRPIGRQMRFMLWDEYHGSPFGLIGLQSPPLVSKIRDSYLGLLNGTKDIWINQSLYAQRLGAIPPYNELLGGKMIGLSLQSNEIRERYAEKYNDSITLMRLRKIPNRLLFITTTSAYGKSSVYERVKYDNELVLQFLGYTSGAGTFQLSEDLYQKCLKFLEQEGCNIQRGYGSGPSRKMKLVSTAFCKLKIKNYQYHNIKRGMYLIPLVKNLNEVIHQEGEPVFFDRNFSDLFDFWLNRWAIPRSETTKEWKKINHEKFIASFEKQLLKL